MERAAGRREFYRGTSKSLTIATQVLKRPLVTAFPVGDISRCFIGTEKRIASFKTLRLQLWLVCEYQKATATRKKSVTAACVSLEIDVLPVRKRHPHTSELRGAEVVEIGRDLWCPV